MSLLDLDARWRRLNDPDYVCPCCGRSFGGLPEMAFAQPDDWPHDAPEGIETIEAGGDRLSSDLCRLGSRRFVRSVLALPVRGADVSALFAVWAEVAPEAFYAILDAIDAGATPDPVCATLANGLPGIGQPPEDTPGRLASAAPQERPPFEATAGRLLATQREGIGFDTLLDLYAALGEDLRPHLAG